MRARPSPPPLVSLDIGGYPPHTQEGLNTHEATGAYSFVPKLDVYSYGPSGHCYDTKQIGTAAGRAPAADLNTITFPRSDSLIHSSE
ncbi:hypothetical protein EVAR_64649_1 [Eumeta japonica]|uniref:Uncharacterized protein n=1 Tax=Eumeta variegata TaxID=151549 RepID=A0A4C1ZJW3_EUMVA|nr:hypothetical protein EVAR_64649_1 [Eumeta japonica]